MNSSTRPDFEIMSTDTHLTVALRGEMALARATQLQADIDAILTDRDVQMDLSGLTRFDVSAAWIITTFKARLNDAGYQLSIIGAGEGPESLLRTVAGAMPKVTQEPIARRNVLNLVADVGKTVAGGVGYFLELISFFGLFLARLFRSITHPKEFRGTALFYHCEQVGLKAVPIVALMAFLIGVVLEFQGSTQLKQFGAEVYVVDLIAVSILRELGILLTAIIVAGRTASAFTAAIGSMKMREEIDAMYSLGLDPAMTLFVPRILALVITLPILGLIANVMGLLGGGIMAFVDLGISPEMFLTRLVNGTDIKHVIVGMVKAPVFALIIGVVGCHAGMKVKSNAESLGQMTSTSVVVAIFAVILADAAFSIFFALIGM